MSNGSLGRLVGVIHLPPLPGSARYGGDLSAIVERTRSEAEMLERAGFDGVMVENFGDMPLRPGRVDAVTVAAMTRCAMAARQGAPSAMLGINVLRNDAESALGIAAACAANAVRINIHMGARVTDQGVIEGRAHETVQLRARLGIETVALLCDVAVKHSSPLGSPRPIEEEATELVQRGCADAVLITGSGTGQAADVTQIASVASKLDAPIYIASGVTGETLQGLGSIHGVIVGSALRASGRAGDLIDEGCARAMVEAFDKWSVAQAKS